MLFILAEVDAIYAFCVAQVGGSLLYAVINTRYFIRRLLPQLEVERWRECFSTFHYGKEHLLLILTMVFHSLLKQFVNSGSEYVMTFTDILSLKVQGILFTFFSSSHLSPTVSAVYDAIEKLVGLVVRVILTPVEESAAVYFTSTVPQRQADGQSSSQALPTIPTRAIRVFSGLLRLTTIMGVIVCAFGFPYSKLAVQLYGGRLLVENGGKIVKVLALRFARFCRPLSPLTVHRISFAHLCKWHYGVLRILSDGHLPGQWILLLVVG